MGECIFCRDGPISYGIYTGDPSMGRVHKRTGVYMCSGCAGERRVEDEDLEKSHYMYYCVDLDRRWVPLDLDGEEHTLVTMATKPP